MDYQECLWKGKLVWVVSIMSKNKVIHRYLQKYVGRAGFVLGTAKNNMLLIEFTHRDFKDFQVVRKPRQIRCIPASCVVEYGVKQQ
jgi:hypothetical protein